MKSKILLITLSLACSISSWGQTLYVPGGFSASGIGASSVAGNVGIGVASPINILDVDGVARFRRLGSTTAGATLGGDALSLRGWGAYNPYIEWRNSTDVRQGYMGWNTNRLSLVMENGYNFTVENGNLGIGTSTPSAKLEVNGDANIGIDAGAITGYGARLQLLGASSNGDALWLSRYNNGANQTELRVNIGDDYGQSQDMFVVGTHYWSNGNWYPHLAVQASGNVGIGTTTPDAKLAVKGTVHANEVKVDLNVPGPDYVFADNYQLQPLNELKSYIDQNKHLPEVPSAAAMEANGINLGEMNMLLLKKVEELTLYVIELKKENEKTASENAQIKTEIIDIKKSIKAYEK